MTWAVFPDDKYTAAVIELLTEAAKPSGSERVMAVVGGALLEEAVDRTLRERLIDDPGVIKKISLSQTAHSAASLLKSIFCTCLEPSMIGRAEH